jgi:hypothetical protein
VDVDYAGQRMFSVGTTLDGNPKDRLCLLDSDPKVTLLIRHDKCTLHSNKHPSCNSLFQRTDPVFRHNLNYMRFSVFTAVKFEILIWVVTPCGHVSG